MTDIASLLHRVARGRHGAGNLNRAEARQVFAALLLPQADPLQLGAFLIAQRMKGESAAELAGFVEAAREHMDGYGQGTAPQGAVDLPCYAGKRRAVPAHLVAAIQVRDAGIPVVIHGSGPIAGRISAWEVLQIADIRRAPGLAEGMSVLQGEGIVYLDMTDICPALMQVLALRPRLGVRSFANTVARLLNPLGCNGQLNGFFHTPYGRYMADANILLQQPRSLIFMGAEGEPELYADRQRVMLLQQDNALSEAGFDGAGTSSYPRQPADDLNALKARFIRLLQGEADGREQAVLARMQQAFRFASTGLIPDDWRVKLVG
ncbi:MAG: anthranilate phosphoribosyltransferase [Mariprofundaceae bacterium]|nr:anthranilate phosphoribosyltransferase [Mariprofundaceae bacterium]